MSSDWPNVVRCWPLWEPSRRPVRLRCTRLLRMFASALVNLYTADIDAGLRFYRDLLGFEETFRTPIVGTPQHVELTLNGFTLGLGTGRRQGRHTESTQHPAVPRWPLWSGPTTSTKPSST
jgi:hypothetical protein